METSFLQGFQEFFPLLACWNDEDRMRVLFSPFRPRDVNPENYDSKMNFWHDTIAAFCHFRGTPVFTIEEIKKGFTRNNNVPVCLPEVIDDLLKSKKIRYLGDFTYDPLNTWTGWAMSTFIKWPIAWGWDKIKGVFGVNAENPEQIKYIYVTVLRELIIELDNLVLSSHEGSVMHINDFTKVVSEDMTILQEGLELCLVTLHLEKKIGLEYNKIGDRKNAIHLIKIPKQGDTLSITDYERALLNLYKSEQSLSFQVDACSKKIMELDEKIRHYLKENQRAMAKTCLRKKRLLDRKLERKSIALHNIEILIEQVEETESNGQILNAYDIGSKALNRLLKDADLQYDNVSGVISEVKESLENAKEIDDSLAILNLPPFLEQETLDLELQEIIDAEKSKEEAERKRIAFEKETGFTDQELLDMLNNLVVLDETLDTAEAAPATDSNNQVEEAAPATLA